MDYIVYMVAGALGSALAPLVAICFITVPLKKMGKISSYYRLKTYILLVISFTIGNMAIGEKAINKIVIPITCILFIVGFVTTAVYLVAYFRTKHFK